MMTHCKYSTLGSYRATHVNHLVHSSLTLLFAVNEHK